MAIVIDRNAGAQAHSAEIAAGERFEFGRNWQRFLALLDDRRIAAAEASLRGMLGVERLDGRSFLDIGSGSGLFSLAARRLGARVRSFDYDPRSVACTQELRRRYFPEDASWEVDQGSVLDGGYLRGLGQFDVVYSWGVLHHTGAMWQAVDGAAERVHPGGRLFISLYNDQGAASRRWALIKRLYCRTPRILRWLILMPCALRLWGWRMLRDSLRGRPFDLWRERRNQRGMSPWHDLVDWVGGHPFEVAKPDDVLRRLHPTGFTLEGMKTKGGGSGCNEYLFSRCLQEGQLRPGT